MTYIEARQQVYGHNAHEIREVALQGVLWIIRPLGSERFKLTSLSALKWVGVSACTCFAGTSVATVQFGMCMYEQLVYVTGPPGDIQLQATHPQAGVHVMHNVELNEKLDQNLHL